MTLTKHLSSRLAAAVRQALDDRRVVGAVVLVTHDGIPVHQQAAGYADRESGRPMTLDTIFRLASVSKPIVATAAMALVAQGRLVLDDDIGRWLPEFQPRLADGRPARITARQLLSHTAGLGYRFFEPDAHGPYARAAVSDGMDDSRVSLAENLRRIASVPLLYEPGTGWGYSLATDVLGALLERVAGGTLDAVVRQLVTAPLGMTDTGFVAHQPARVATPYVNQADTAPHRLAEGELVPPFAGTVGIAYSPARIFDAHAFPSAGAGMAGTAGDMLRLLEALRRDGGILPEALVAEMGRDQTGGRELAAGPGLGFGLGWSVLRDPALAGSPESVGTWRWGGAYGHSWLVDRARGLSMVAFTNTLYEGMTGRFVTDLRDALY